MLATICVILLSISESLDLYLRQTHSHYEIRLILAAISFTSRISCIGFTAAITQRINSVRLNLIYLGMILNAVLAFLSIPTGIIFYFNSDNIWKRGFLYFVPYFFALWFASILIVSGLKNFRTNKKESVLIIAGTIICLLGNALELFRSWKLSLSASFITYICFYFLCLNVELYRHDAMTTLFNRRSFFMDARRFRDKKFVLVSIDLNDLKLYNDLQGHSAGDKALCTVADCMKSAFRNKGFSYRTGGDEFMAIFPDFSADEVKPFIESFISKLSKTKYRVACGYACYVPGSSFDAVMEKADQEMYINKRTMKGENGIIR